MGIGSFRVQLVTDMSGDVNRRISFAGQYDNMTRVQLEDQHSTRVSACHRGNRNGLRARGWMGMAGYHLSGLWLLSQPIHPRRYKYNTQDGRYVFLTAHLNSQGSEINFSHRKSSAVQNGAVTDDPTTLPFASPVFTLHETIPFRG